MDGLADPQALKSDIKLMAEVDLSELTLNPEVKSVNMIGW